MLCFVMFYSFSTILLWTSFFCPFTKVAEVPCPYLSSSCKDWVPTVNTLQFTLGILVRCLITFIYMNPFSCLGNDCKDVHIDKCWSL